MNPKLNKNDTKNQILYTDISVYGYPQADSILCNNGRIESIGLFKTYKNTFETISLGGGYLYPGFNDTHLHLLGLGEFLNNVQLFGLPGTDHVVQKLKKHINALPSGENQKWIRGMGWDQNIWEPAEFPQKNILDSVSSERPICLSRADGHAFWVNSKALELAGITNDTPDPPGGKIIRINESEVPSGVLLDRAMDLISRVVPPLSAYERKNYIITAIQHLHSFGITSIGDAGTDPETFKVLGDLLNAGKLNLRINAMIPWREKSADYVITENEYLRAKTYKIYLDGALGSRGAALLEPYSDDKTNAGLLLEKIEEVSQFVSMVNKNGYQVAIHAIGDRANRLALDCFQNGSEPTSSSRNRIEHAQIIHKTDLQRFKDLNVLAAIQPTHCTSDMGWTEERLGKNRISSAYPWASLVEMGLPLLGGSDAPIESPDPLKGLFAASTRQNEDLHPEGGWYPREKLSLKNAFKAYTEWAAISSFEEDQKGIISPGYFADFVVLSSPIDFEKPETLLSTVQKATIVNGKLVHETL